MNDTDRIRVMTVDDHEIMRGGIKFTLLAFDDIELVGEARNGEEAVSVCAEVMPDVILMDLRMSKMDGIAATKAIKDLHADVQIVMLTSFHDPGLVQRAIRAGAAGYLLKDASKGEVANAIRNAHAGRTALSSEAVHDLVGSEAGPLGGDLTDRERAVLVLLAQGLSNKEIAGKLYRSPFTVRHHVSQIIAKLGASNRAEAAALAVQHGLVE